MAKGSIQSSGSCLPSPTTPLGERAWWGLTPRTHGPRTHSATGILLLGSKRTLSFPCVGPGGRGGPLASRTLGPAPAHSTTASFCQPASAWCAASISSGLSFSQRQAWRRRNRRLSLWLCWPRQDQSPLTHRGSHTHIPTPCTYVYLQCVCIPTANPLPSSPIVNYSAEIHRCNTHRAHTFLSPL